MAKLVEADRKMEQESRNLAGQVRKQTDTQKRAVLRKTLEELTAKHFDLRQQQRQLQIDRMEAELEKIRQAVQKRTDAKKLIVQRRVSQLLGEQDELAFPPPPRFQQQMEQMQQISAGQQRNRQLDSDFQPSSRGSRTYPVSPEPQPVEPTSPARRPR